MVEVIGLWKSKDCVLDVSWARGLMFLEDAQALTINIPEAGMILYVDECAVLTVYLPDRFMLSCFAE